MSVSPLRSSSDEEWNFDSFAGSSSPVLETEKSIKDAALAQLKAFQEMEEQKELQEKPLQRSMYFHSTILILASAGCFDEALELINRAETEQVWQSSLDSRAKSYLYVIETFIEKGFHDKAKNLYSHALEGKVWDGFAKQQEVALQALNEVGYRYL